MSNMLDTIWNLLFDADEAQKYHQDPEGYLEETGLDQCDPAELQELFVLANEKGPVNQGATVSVGGNQAVAPHAAPPPPPLDPTMPASEAIAQTVNYYVTNTTTTNVDDRDTNVDSSVNTNVLAGDGADIALDIDNDTNTASGDGAVATDENDGNIITGGADGAIVSEDSNLDGNFNTGSADGAVFADDSDLQGVGTGSGDVSVVDLDFENSGDVDLDDVNLGQNITDNSIEDSYNDNSVTDSYNSTTDDHSVTDSYNTDNSVDDYSYTDNSVDDSYNEQSQVGDDSFDDQQVQESFNDEGADLADQI